MSFHPKHFRVLAALALLGACATAAEAGCYDVFGCSDRDRFRAKDLASGPNCEFLYEMRNEIYHSKGFCFRQARAIRTFGNDGCRFRSLDQVPLTRIERLNAATIARVEKSKGCG